MNYIRTKFSVLGIVEEQMPEISTFMILRYVNSEGIQGCIMRLTLKRPKQNRTLNARKCLFNSVGCIINIQ